MTAATALVLEAPRSLVAREFELPEITDDDAILRVEACGLCGTDHELYTGAVEWPPGFVPGHETVGVVERIGSAAAERWGVQAGSRVAVGNRRACRECAPCRAGDLARCERFGSPKSYGMVSADIPPSLWGGYATHHYLAPESVLHPVPAGVDPVVATLFNPLGAGIDWAVDMPRTGPGDVVAVLGPGIRGIAAVVAARAAGARFVMVTGHGERDAARLAAARQMGADLAVDVAVTDPVDALHGAAGQLADVVVDVTAKAPTAFAQALELTERHARVVVAGIRGRSVTATVVPDLVPTRELRVLGASGVAADAHRRAVELVASGRFPFESLPRRTAGFADVGELLSTMAGETDAVAPLHNVFVPA
ncbi:MAG TPA: alcohol dehydrogenase catalytic domain-containing protein [Acidimicrobiia bacterium]|nr:alcohol dehydrogenase catalytic domain-containing protein [Acidimicrobiia bacterium]